MSTHTQVNKNADYPVRNDTAPDGSSAIQLMRLCVASGDGVAEDRVTRASGIPTSQTLVTFTPTRPSITNNSSTQVIAANASRKAGSYIVNNTTTKFWLQYGAAAVLNQGVPLAAGQLFFFNTAQEIRAIQNSGGDLVLDVFEAT